MLPSTPLTMGFYYNRFNKSRCPLYCSFLVQIELGREISKNLHKETLSQPFDLKWSVPQGSCLGPLLFLLFIHKTCSLNASARLIYCARKSCPITRLCFASYIGYLFATVLNTKSAKLLHGKCVAAWMRGYSAGKREEYS